MLYNSRPHTCLGKRQPISMHMSVNIFPSNVIVYHDKLVGLNTVDIDDTHNSDKYRVREDIDSEKVFVLRKKYLLHSVGLFVNSFSPSWEIKAQKCNHLNRGEGLSYRRLYASLGPSVLMCWLVCSCIRFKFVTCINTNIVCMYVYIHHSNHGLCRVGHQRNLTAVNIFRCTTALIVHVATNCC